jgi:hypothetical protein
MDTQLKKELTDAIKSKKYYTAIRGILTVSGIDTHTGGARSYPICLKGEFKKGFESDGTVWSPRFEGRAAIVGKNALTDDSIIVEFPVCDTWNPRQIARSMALNVGVIYGLEI